MPGHLRWGLLEPWAVAWSPAVVAGVLYDTGCGWPAAVVDVGPRRGVVPAGRVPGWVVELRPDVVAAVMGTLDEVEGIGSVPDPAVDRFERVVAVTGPIGLPAWVYSATRVGADWLPIDRWEGRPER